MDDKLDLEYERLLGEGSYGKVFLVRQQDGQLFAIKEIDLSKCDEDGRTQALHEASLLSRLKHENILTYIESVINDEGLYIVTEFCGGGDLEDYLETVRKSKLTVPEPLVSEWILQIGGALKYLHDLRILHRDMKTKNIFLKEDLTVKLGDLGIAKVLDLNQSKANTFIGTPSYMSPELFTGKPYNHKTDIWGLGCCAYEMLTLKRAFEGKALWTLIREIKNGKELDLPDEYSLELRVLIEEMMSQDPNTRPSANDIVEHDYLSYHRGTAKERVSQLPVPGKKEEKKKKVSANLSGSFDRMLQQKNKQEDLRLRSSVVNICEKINTLRSSMAGDEDMGTFVYHGNRESDEELEASNTILDSDTLRQFTQQLDTFVYKGDSDSDSDYYTEGSLGRKGGGDEQDGNRTLITQYSNSLEEMEKNGEETGNNTSVQSVSEETEGSGVQIKDVEDRFDPDDNFLLQMNDRLEETLTSKYSKYNRLKDTLTLSQGKKFRRSQSESSPSAIKTQQIFDRTVKDSSKLNFSKYLSASFSGADTLHAGQTIESISVDPRLNNTFSSERQLKQSVVKMKTCDRLEQSFLSKSKSSKGLKPAKKAFTDEEVKPSGDLDVTGVMSHLKEKLTLYTEENANHAQEDIEGSPNRKGKKKNPFIKKEAARKKSLDSDHEKINIPPSSEKNVTLYTRAQAVTFNKEEEEGIDE